MEHRIALRTWLAVVFAGTMSLALGYLLWRYVSHDTPVQVGDMAPNILATTVNHRPFQLRSLQGEPVVLDFFTAWCAPCLSEAPTLNAFARQYGNKVHVVLIDRGDGPGLVREYVQKYNTPSQLTVLLNPNDNWSLKYGVTGQPETFFIAPDGKIVKHTLGPLTEAQLLQYAEQAGM